MAVTAREVAVAVVTQRVQEGTAVVLAAAVEKGVRARAAVKTKVAAMKWAAAGWGEAAMAPVARVPAEGVVGASWEEVAMA